MVDGSRKIARAAGVISAATFFSRILGFIRDMVVAKAFGAGMATDAFFVAFRLPNMLRELLGEGALSASFVPVFAERLLGGRKEAWELARKTLTLLGLLLIAVSLLGVLIAPVLVRILAPGFSTVPEKLQLTVRLTRFVLFFPTAHLPQIWTELFRPHLWTLDGRNYAGRRRPAGGGAAAIGSSVSSNVSPQAQRTRRTFPNTFTDRPQAGQERMTRDVRAPSGSCFPLNMSPPGVQVGRSTFSRPGLKRTAGARGKIPRGSTRQSRALHRAERPPSR